jgi:hypothetical protein
LTQVWFWFMKTGLNSHVHPSARAACATGTGRRERRIHPGKYQERP